jgi:hypothetical protein
MRGDLVVSMAIRAAPELGGLSETLQRELRISF